MHASGTPALGVTAACLLLASLATAVSAADDPRVGLTPGYFPWTEASSNIELLDNDPRVAPFDAPPGNFGFVNSDLAFTGDHAIMGSFNGFQVYDLSDPSDPVARQLVRVPRRSGRRLGLRRPAVHVRRGDPRPHRLRHAGRSPAR